MKKQELIYLSKADVQGIGLKMDEAIQTLEKVFCSKAEGHTEFAPKARIHIKGDSNIINAIPAYSPDFNLVGLKWASKIYDNKTKKIPDESGLIILSDHKTGCPLAMMDSTTITDLHTSAAILLSAKKLALPDSTVISVVGCSSSVIGPVVALHDNYHFRKLLLFDVDNNSAKSVGHELSIRIGKQVQIVETSREAIEESNIIITARSSAGDTIGTNQAGSYQTGALIIMVDPNSCLHTDTLREVSKTYTEDMKQFLQYKDAGFFNELPDMNSDLIDLIGKKKPGRESSNEIILYVNIGWGVNDLAIADLIYRRASKEGIGTRLSL